MKIEFLVQADHPGVSLRGLCVVNEHSVWASGSGGSIARTTDGGAAWRWARIPGHEELDFRSIKAFSDTCALVANAGSPATILKTCDGGVSWKVCYSDESGRLFFDALGFWDERSGVALSDALDDGCCIMETRDSGQTWSRIPVSGLPKMEKGESHFAASGSCLAVFGSGGLCFVSGGSAARVFMSLDRGKTWKVGNLPLMHRKPSQGAFSVAILGTYNAGAVDEVLACVVGGDYAEPGIDVQTAAYSENGGLSWREAEMPPPGGYNSCVAYLPIKGGTYLLACGTQGSHLSKDGGRTWSLLNTESFHVLAFDGGGEQGWAAGSEGRIAKILLH